MTEMSVFMATSPFQRDPDEPYCCRPRSQLGNRTEDEAALCSTSPEPAKRPAAPRMQLVLCRGGRGGEQRLAAQAWQGAALDIPARLSAFLVLFKRDIDPSSIQRLWAAG